MMGWSAGPSGGSAGQRRNKPEWMIGPNDLGQVMVLILRRKPDEHDGAEMNGQRSQVETLPDSFIVGASIELVIGQKEARALNASREGRGSRYLLRTSSINVIEKLTKMTELTDGTKIEIVPHPTLNTVQGIVYDTDSINKDENSILGHLESQGVHAVRRIKKRVNGTLKNTPLLVLSFRGTLLPEYVYFGLLRIEVDVYYPTPMLCFNCGFYGHSKKFCQQTGICLRCSAPHHAPDGEQCVNPPNCLHCKTGHHTTSRDCPKYKEEEKIIRVKIDKGVSFAEARRMCAEDPKKQTFSSIVQEQIQQELAAKDQLIATLQKQVEMLTKELSALKEIVRPTTHNQAPATSDTRPSASNKTSSQTTPCTPLQKKVQQSPTERLSRKDQTFVAPPARQRENRKNNNSDHGVETRSRSKKRHMEISPNEAVNKQGKRISTQQDTDNASVDVEMNNGPGSL